MRHFIIADGILALLLVLALGWLYVNAQPPVQPTREMLCAEVLTLRYAADLDVERSTPAARDFIATITDAELALLHEFPAGALRYVRSVVDKESDQGVWNTLGLAELECRGIEWQRTPHE